jgi:hypothetical protein
MMAVSSYVVGKAAELFTSVLFNNYSPPPGFCFDVLCDDEPFIDDKHSPDYNVDKLVCPSHVIWKIIQEFSNVDAFKSSYIISYNISYHFIIIYHVYHKSYHIHILLCE